MANGFFLGGVAEGMEAAEKQRLARETLATETGLREKQLGLDGQRVGLAERAQALAEKQAARAVGDKDRDRAASQIDALMSSAAEAAKAGLAAGRPPEVIQKVTGPLIEQAQRLAPYAKQDPAAIGARGQALLSGSTQAEAIGAKTAISAAEKKGEIIGTAQGQVDVATILKNAGVEPSPFKDPKDKVTAEGALRDDFSKRAAPHFAVRDAKQRLDTIEDTGAGDMALVFQYMKILDPGSTVREGEFATASNAAGVPAAIIGQYNKAVGGGLLAPQARKEIRSQAEKIYQASTRQYDKLQSNFAGIAKRQGLNPDNVIIDETPSPPPKAGGLNIPEPPNGFKVVK